MPLCVRALANNALVARAVVAAAGQLQLDSPVAAPSEPEAPHTAASPSTGKNDL